MKWDGKAYDMWLTTDPNDGPECPECGAPVEGDKWEGRCTDEECDYSYEDDYESIIRDREEAHWSDVW